MWNFASTCVAGGTGPKKGSKKSTEATIECSDDEASSVSSRDEGLECPICWESFNIVENVPYVLWCGHTLCKNCILGLQFAVVKLPTLPLQLPLFILCPWCNVLSPRLVIRGNLKFPRKNFFLLWMVERMNGDRVKPCSVLCGDHHTIWPSSQVQDSQYRSDASSGSNHGHVPVINYLTVERIHSSLRKSLMFFTHLTTKFPLVLIFLLIVSYAIPACAAVLALYLLITVIFALPSFLILYYAYPSLDWLVREIVT